MSPVAILELLSEHLRQDPLMILMAVCSVLIVAVAFERLLVLVRARLSLGRVEDRILEAARKGNLEEARRSCDGLPSPLREVFASGLDRALGRVKGDPGMAMAREQKRAIGQFRTMVWTLGTAGALMPFVGLLGTVVGVMGSFRAIGESGQGGFAVVSAGISQALIATAVGLFVALEAVVLFNLLQNAGARIARELSLLVDEMNEIIHTWRRENAGSAAS
jgi:biopolymer transport protein ExbB